MKDLASIIFIVVSLWALNSVYELIEKDIPHFPVCRDGRCGAR